MQKLVCDRCGLELKNNGEIDLALQGKETWANSVRARGGEPRGVFPCRDYIRCRGEMKLVES